MTDRFFDVIAWPAGTPLSVINPFRRQQRRREIMGELAKLDLTVSQRVTTNFAFHGIAQPTGDRFNLTTEAQTLVDELWRLG